MKKHATAEQSNVNRRIAIFVAIMTIVFMLAFASFMLLIYFFSGSETPQINNLEKEFTQVVYDYEKIATELDSHEGSEDLCETLYPDIYKGSKYKSFFWDDTINPTTIQVKIYLEVNLNDKALVRFSQTEVDVQRWIPNQFGSETVDVTDQVDYENILRLALKKTGGNRGFMAYWKVTLINDNPNHYTASGGCAPIPFE